MEKLKFMCTHQITNILFLAVFVFIFFYCLLNYPRIQIFSGINCIIYFLLFLISLFIVIKDNFTKDVFLNFAIMFLFYSFILFVELFKTNLIFINLSFVLIYSPYFEIILKYITVFVITYLVFKYIFRNIAIVYLYMLTLFVTLLFITVCFVAYWGIHSTSINNINMLKHGELILNLLTIMLILFYAFIMYKNDRLNGEYINMFLTGFFIFQVLNVVQIVSQLYESSAHSINQFTFLLNLMFFLTVLIQKLKYTYSYFGEFYEKLIFTNTKVVNLKIKKKKLFCINYIILLSKILSEKRNLYTCYMLGVSFFILFSPLPVIVKINIFVLMLCFLIIFAYIVVLHQKRIKKGDLILNR